jgi:hypothetical protein
MTYEQVKQHFGTIAEAARQLDYTHQAIYQWAQKGIPLRTQRTIQAFTGGKLKADKDKR